VRVSISMISILFAQMNRAVWIVLTAL